MKLLRTISAFLFGAFLIYGGLNHFLNPEFYNAFMPDFFPKLLANYASGLVEIVLGIGLFVPKYRQQAALGSMWLMVIFLPLHIWDVFKENPAIGNHTAGWIRIAVQFLFIAWMYSLSKKPKET